MNYYSHHIGDYLSATAHLTLLEHGAYRRLIDVYYINESALPADQKQVHRLVGARTKEEREAVDTVLNEFFALTELGWSQSRCDHEIGLCNKNRTNGNKGGRPPKNQNPNETQTKPKPEPKQNPNETQVISPLSPHHPISETSTSSLRSEVVPFVGKKKKTTFAAWRKLLKESGEKAISDYQPVWEYAQRVGIPAEWVEIAWLRFTERYAKDANHTGKTYIDWRKVFLNAVEDNWFGIWYGKDGKFALTTVGQQAEIATRSQA